MRAITNDFVNGGNKIGAARVNHNEAKAGSAKHRFHLLDGDGKICHEGLPDDWDSQRAFAPMDGFGKGHGGCEEIHHPIDDVWRQL